MITYDCPPTAICARGTVSVTSWPTAQGKRAVPTMRPAPTAAGHLPVSIRSATDSSWSSSGQRGGCALMPSSARQLRGASSMLAGDTCTVADRHDLAAMAWHGSRLSHISGQHVHILQLAVPWTHPACAGATWCMVGRLIESAARAATSTHLLAPKPSPLHQHQQRSAGAPGSASPCGDEPCIPRHATGAMLGPIYACATFRFSSVCVSGHSISVQL